MEGRVLLAYLCVCMFVALTVGAKPQGLPDTKTFGGDGGPVDSGDVIMKEDAEEAFYGIDLDKFEGVRCPELTPPEHGSITGGGSTVGSVAYVKCKEGFGLVGPAVLACMPVEDGAKWNPPVSHSLCVVMISDFDETNLPADPVEPVGKKSYIQEENADEPEQAPEEDLKQELEQEPMEEPVRTKTNDGPPFIDPRVHPEWIQTARDGVPNSRKLSEPDELEEESFPSRRGLPPMCRLPPGPGPCMAYFQRFYFDQSTMECRKFIYGGCRGNENNFRSLEECDDKCSASER